MFAVYRVLKDGRLKYVPRSVTTSESLARDIASGLSRGEIVMPDGSVRHVQPRPHIYRPLEQA